MIKKILQDMKILFLWMKIKLINHLNELQIIIIYIINYVFNWGYWDTLSSTSEKNMWERFENELENVNVQRLRFDHLSR
jgi:hypothetical protein